MKGGKGIENPAFVSSSPDTPRRFSASPSYVEVSVLCSSTQREDSQPHEPQEPQKSREPPLPSATHPGSREPESLSEFEEGPCGWGNFQPQCFQLCNTPQGFLVHYCLLALTQGKVRGGWRGRGPRGGRGGARRAGGREGGCVGGQVIHAPCLAAPAGDLQVLASTLTNSVQTSTF